jgi:ADP-ribosylglycohydrolase
VQRNYIKDALFGLAVGDALGVPYEFKSRQEISRLAEIEMTGYGTHGQPPGTFSDDSSLAFCLAESLVNGYSLQDIASRFRAWLYNKEWSAHGHVFDVGIATREAIQRLRDGVSPLLSGGTGEWDNGNGSLMRIMPLLFFIRNKSPEERFLITKEVSGITHRHIRSVIACFYYLEYASLLVSGMEKTEAFGKMQFEFLATLAELKVPVSETLVFQRLLSGNIYEREEKDISGNGYVVHTLEAGLWCLLNTGNYRDALVAAIRLGEDNDTTAAVTGGLSGLVYCYSGIPAEWLRTLARHDDISDLADRYHKSLG